MLGEAPHLDQNYTVWGKVISGMQIIKSLPIGDIQNNGQVKNPANIVEMYESDIDGNRIHTHELNNMTTNDATY
jgi:cyclophilin family peptidyl-prolyl cis-trans isomerase